MAIRDTLLANITSALSGSNVSVSSELPWDSGAVPLYQKNMKKFYLGAETHDVNQMVTTLDTNDVFQQETLLTGYVTVDAKNQPGDIGNIVSSIVNSRLSVSNNFFRECIASTEIEDDRITYSFDYRFLTLK